MLDTLFSHILDMTLRGSVVILAVLILRLFLRKAPKVFSYALWAVVLFRLICPVSIQLPVSVIPDMQSVAAGYSFDHDPITVIDAGKAVYQVADDAVNGQLDVQQIYIDVPSQVGGHRLRAATLLEICVMAGQYVWLAGVAGLMIYVFVSYLRLRRQLIGATPLRSNIFVADHIETPFVLGLVKPRIYLPSFLDGREQDYIIVHEQHHIRRLDHVMKLLGFAALTLHWFNPLVWLAYFLFCKDMEMSCDEAVIRKLGADIRADYSASLLNLATRKRAIGITPLAFGEGDTKGRIQNLSRWKKPVGWVIGSCAILCVVTAICLLTDPIPNADPPGTTTAAESPVPQPGGTSPSETFGVTLTYAGYSREGLLYTGALNSAKMSISSVQHLPIYKMDTRQELDRFMDTYGTYLSMKESYGEIPSFSGVAERFDDAFFAEQTLMLVYIPSGSGTYRYGVDSIYCGQNSFCIHVKRTDHALDFTDDTAGWILVVEVPDSMVRGVENFDADLDNTTMSLGPQVTKISQDVQLSELHIKMWLPGTDFSRISGALQSQVDAQWRTYDAMTPWQRSLSSHVFGLVYWKGDTWEQCEEELGFTVKNPIGQIPWLTATDSYGGISTDPNATHIEMDIHATEATDRQVGSVNITAGYRTEGVRVVLRAQLQKEKTLYGTGQARSGDVRYFYTHLQTASGLPVLLVTTQHDGNYADMNAYWGDGNVFYTLHLVGGKGEDQQLREILVRILAQI